MNSHPDLQSVAASANKEAALVDQQGITYKSQDLFKGVREITITHAGASYRLRITQANKLILTK